MKYNNIVITVLIWLCLLTGCDSKTQEALEAPEIDLRAKAFDLSQVKLLDGPFRDAMKVNEEYLLFLDPDRLLAWFRKEAGLEPKGKVYGGWESEGYVISGHTLGHYLSALSKQYQATGSQAIKDRLDYIIQELKIIQKENGDGYLSAIKDGRQLFSELSEGNIRSRGTSLNGVKVPWYTMDKLFNGLTQAYTLGDNKEALDIVIKLTDWAYRLTENLTQEDWEEMLKTEYGGMTHSLANIYAITGNPKHLELAKKFSQDQVLYGLAKRQDNLMGLHANTQIPKVRGMARLYELTGNEKYSVVPKFFWKQVVNHYTYVNGGNSSKEAFGPPGELSTHLEQTTETCNTFNMLWLTRFLFTWQPDGKYMDYYERALFNHILASHNPETGMFIYKGYLSMPAKKGYSSPENSFWCCVGTGMENHTNYGKAIYYHNDDSLYVNLFIASELDWEEQGVTIRQETQYPYEDHSRLIISTDEPIELSLLIRNPVWWGESFNISLNGDELSTTANDGYVEIRRTFSDGDIIDIGMPMNLRIETMPDDPNRIAFFYGPTLLNAILDANPEGYDWRRNDEYPVPELTGTKSEILNAMQPVDGEPLHFIAKNAGRVKNKDTGEWETVDLHFKPQFKTVDEVYTVYLDISN